MTNVYRNKRMDKNVNDCIELGSSVFDHHLFVKICALSENGVFYIIRNLYQKKNYYDDVIVGFPFISVLASTFNIHMNAR